MNEEIIKPNTEDIKPKVRRYSKTKKIFFVLIAVVFVFTGIAGFSYANKMKQLRDDGPMLFMMGKIVKDLNLTDAQKKQVSDIKDEIKAKMDDNKKNRKDDAADFENAFKQDKLDKDNLQTLIKKREADREAMRDFMLDELIKFHDVLTPDQRSQVVTKIEEMKSKHDTWKHKDKNAPPNN